MNTKEIEALIKFVQKSGILEVQIEDKDFKINIKTANAHPEYVPQISLPVQQAPVIAAPVVQTVAPVGTPAPSAPPAPASNQLIQKSPMIGTFYRSSSPDKPALVNVGDEVKPGQVICIIEAMKLFNEIECEFAGKVIKVMVDNAKPVEYDQPLFIIEPL